MAATRDSCLQTRCGPSWIHGYLVTVHAQQCCHLFFLPFHWLGESTSSASVFDASSHVSRSFEATRPKCRQYRCRWQQQTQLSVQNTMVPSSCGHDGSKSENAWPQPTDQYCPVHYSPPYIDTIIWIWNNKMLRNCNHPSPSNAQCKMLERCWRLTVRQSLVCIVRVQSSDHFDTSQNQSRSSGPDRHSNLLSLQPFLNTLAPSFYIVSYIL